MRPEPRGGPREESPDDTLLNWSLLQEHPQHLVSGEPRHRLRVRCPLGEVINHHLIDLVAKGILERVGTTGKGTFYMVRKGATKGAPWTTQFELPAGGSTAYVSSQVLPCRIHQ